MYGTISSFYRDSSELNIEVGNLICSWLSHAGIVCGIFHPSQVGLLLFYSLRESQVEHLMAKCYCQLSHDYILSVNKCYIMWANMLKCHGLKLFLFDYLQ